jgi:hypothetical protein
MVARYLAFCASLVAFACGDSAETPASHDAGAESGSVDAGSEAAMLPVDGSTDSACQTVSFAATSVTKPLDVVLVVDNSGSMADEIAAIEASINVDFAQILEAAGIDYRVILVSRYQDAGVDFGVCVAPPLGPGPCPPPAEASAKSNPPKFFHHDIVVASQDAWCKLLFAYDVWKPSLRPEAFKAFVVFSDDNVQCTWDQYSCCIGAQAANQYNDGKAAVFDADLLATDPEQFGTPTVRNYAWHSIVGIAPKADPLAPYLPSDPVVTEKCGSADKAGIGHQNLSIMTNGLRFPVCGGAGFDAVFHSVAASAIESVSVPCTLEVPKPPTGKTYEWGSLEVIVSSATSPTASLKQVASAADCTGEGFYIEADVIQLCPAACSAVTNDSTAKLELSLSCATVIY